MPFLGRRIVGRRIVGTDGRRLSWPLHGRNSRSFLKPNTSSINVLTPLSKWIDHASATVQTVKVLHSRELFHEFPL